MTACKYQPGETLPGTVYRVVRHLATGGMGSVYEVEDVTVEKRYVLKTLHPNLVTREDLARRMRDEAKSLAKLDHPNIVEVVTAGVTSDLEKMPFYVMERLVGQNLRVVLDKNGPLSMAPALRIAIDVADALEHAHEHHIVHRDVKPENIFLHRNTNGTATTKLLDFGIVRLLDRQASQTHGKFIGTLRYASPEQVVGRTVGPATDIYSLGLVLFEMLAGCGPFDDAGDAYAVGSAHATVTAPPLSRFVNSIAPEVERLLASALAKEAEERPRDCFTFASTLRRLLREEEASPRSVTAVNVLASAQTAVQTVGGVVLRSSGPTAVLRGHAGGASATVTLQDPVNDVSSRAVFADGRGPLGDVPPTRPEGRAALDHPVSPIAPTLAAAMPFAVHPSPALPAFEDAVRIDRAPPRAIDRSAPTRESAPFAGPMALAPNGTQLEAGLAVAHIDVRNGGGTTEAMARPALSTSPSLVRPASPMDPGAAKLRTDQVSARPPPNRTAAALVGALIVLTVGVVGGFLALRQPWRAKGGLLASGPSVVASTSGPSVVASTSGPSVVASTSGPSVVASTSGPSGSSEVAGPQVGASGASTSEVSGRVSATGDASVGLVPTASSRPAPLKPRRPDGPAEVKAPRPSPVSRPSKPSAPLAPKDVPFDP